VRINPDGTLGEDNNVTCGGIEGKMGIHGSPTCTLILEKGCNEGMAFRKGEAWAFIYVSDDECCKI